MEGIAEDDSPQQRGKERLDGGNDRGSDRAEYGEPRNQKREGDYRRSECEQENICPDFPSRRQKELVADDCGNYERDRGTDD